MFYSCCFLIRYCQLAVSLCNDLPLAISSPQSPCLARSFVANLGFNCVPSRARDILQTILRIYSISIIFLKVNLIAFTTWRPLI